MALMLSAQQPHPRRGGRRGHHRSEAEEAAPPRLEAHGQAGAEGASGFLNRATVIAVDIGKETVQVNGQAQVQVQVSYRCSIAACVSLYGHCHVRVCSRGAQPEAQKPSAPAAEQKATEELRVSATEEQRAAAAAAEEEEEIIVAPQPRKRLTRAMTTTGAGSAFFASPSWGSRKCG